MIEYLYSKTIAQIEVSENQPTLKMCTSTMKETEILGCPFNVSFIFKCCNFKVLNVEENNYIPN
jgi:hypothetical protein